MRVFLAHAAEDRERILDLHEKLRAAGCDPWIDQVNLSAGQNWQLEIPKAIRESQVFIACLSNNSVSKHGYVQKEFRLALNTYAEKPPGAIYLIPLRLDDCEIPDHQIPELAIHLRDIQWLDYWKPGGFQKLLAAIKSSGGEVTTHILPSIKPPLSSTIPSAKGFVGRENDLEELRQGYAKGARVFILHGLGGAGKTALAQQFAEEIKEAYDTHIYIDLQGVNENSLSPADAILQIVREFDPSIPDGTTLDKLEKRYISYLNEHRVLLLLDNSKDDNQIAPLNKSNNSCLLVTSRESSFLMGAIIRRIEQMSIQDGRTLLFSIADEDRFDGHADELAHLAGYLPMALLPLAALLKKNERIAAIDLIRIYQDRQQRLLLARPEYRNNITVYASFDLSYEVLNDEFKKYWRRLAVFPADFHNGGPGYVWQIESREKIDAILSHLCQSNLLNNIPKTERYTLHDLARDFLTQKIMEVQELESASHRHAQFYLLVLEKAALFIEGENYEAAWCYFDGERSNIDAGRNWAMNFGEQNESAAQLHRDYTRLDPELVTKGLHPRKLIELHLAALKAARELKNRPAEINALKDLEITHRSLGEYKNAFSYHKEMLRNAQKHKYRPLECEIWSNLGLLYCDLGNSRKAFISHDRALDMLEESPDPVLYSKILINLGIAHRRIYPPGAVEFFNRALEISRAVNRPQDEGICLGHLGKTYIELSQFGKAIDFLEQALQVARTIRDRETQGIYLGDLGVAHINLGDSAKGRQLLRNSIAVLEEIDSPDALSFRFELNRFSDH